jgi:hypothetical protein
MIDRAIQRTAQEALAKEMGAMLRGQTSWTDLDDDTVMLSASNTYGGETWCVTAGMIRAAEGADWLAIPDPPPVHRPSTVHPSPNRVRPPQPETWWANRIPIAVSVAAGVGVIATGSGWAAVLALAFGIVVGVTLVPSQPPFQPGQ